MDDLVTWLGAQLDEDERVAKQATPGPWSVDLASGMVSGRLEGQRSVVGTTHFSRWDRAFICEFNPARVLAEVEAKRAILAEYGAALDRKRRHPDDLAVAGDLLAVVRIIRHHLALPYRDRPGYRPEWAPDR